MENNRFYMLPEDCQMLIWSKVFNDCINGADFYAGIEESAYWFWYDKMQKEGKIFKKMYDEYSRERTIGLSQVIKQENKVNDIFAYIADFLVKYNDGKKYVDDDESIYSSDDEDVDTQVDRWQERMENQIEEEEEEEEDVGLYYENDTEEIDIDEENDKNINGYSFIEYNDFVSDSDDDDE